jgi:hypothetical protein
MDILVIVFPILAVFLVIAFTRSATVDSAPLTSKTITIESVLPPAEVFQRIQGGVGKFAHEASDPARGIVVLTTKPSFATWGFFYPVHIVESANGSTLTVGIRSRVFQIGPLVTAAHRQCEKAIEQQLVGSASRHIPSARVV